MSCRLSWPPCQPARALAHTKLAWVQQNVSPGCTECLPFGSLITALQCSKLACSNSLQIAVPGLHAACPLPGRMSAPQYSNLKVPACRWVERAAAGETPNDRKMSRNLECILDGRRLVVYGEPSGLR